jgi:thioredoxin 1
MAGTTREFTSQNFDSEVVKSDIPVLVDFWAEWCGPCKLIEPSIKEIAGEYDGKLRVGKLDVEAHQDIMTKYQVSRLPALFIFKGGEVVEKIFGSQSKGKILDAVKPHLS